MDKKKSLGALLVSAMEEALDIERGVAKPARSHRVAVTARAASAPAAPVFDKARVTKVRQTLDVSQPVFAQLLNVSAATVRSWEQGQRVPDGAAARLLEIVEQRPNVLTAKLSPISSRGAQQSRSTVHTKRRAGTAR